MKITKEDVGRKVVDRRGEVETIIAFREGSDYPVLTKGCNNSEFLYSEDGVYFFDRPGSIANLTRFLDEDDLLTLAGE